MDHNEPSQQIIRRFVVNPSQYEANAAKINDLKRIVEDMEKQNESGYIRYQLEEKIKAGKQAEEMLVQFAQAESSQHQLGDVLGASTSTSTVNATHSSPNLLYPMDVEDYGMVPTTARIVEVTSSAENTRSFSRRSSNSSAPQYNQSATSSTASSSYRAPATINDNYTHYYPHIQHNTYQRSQAYGGPQTTYGYGNQVPQTNPASQYYRATTTTTNAYSNYPNQTLAQNQTQAQNYNQNQRLPTRLNAVEMDTLRAWAQYKDMQAPDAQQRQSAVFTSDNSVSANVRGPSSLDGALGNMFSSGIDSARSTSVAAITAQSAWLTPTSRTATPTSNASAGRPSVQTRTDIQPRSSSATNGSDAAVSAPAIGKFFKSSLAKTLMSQYKQGLTDSADMQSPPHGANDSQWQQSTAIAAPKANATPATANATSTTSDTRGTLANQSEANPLFKEIRPQFASRFLRTLLPLVFREARQSHPRCNLPRRQRCSQQLFRRNR
ncbi:hypothetical protein NEOLEDRAFT_600823 [Neolentinus lepideus HHB14362 ss-1]|uniref:Uncharacterized protein n=1 Tax=Neolentinus lepideus HHB14362 ss-1 TaxID=1314782 RepID=A0A165VBF6_9AGAM|nr:hypothetical protein NEOLEDRAFT_600823 [Neolentinus lepideus HHB14362 ss-1]